MSKKEQLKTEIELINNAFKLDEAKTLLLQLIQDKINFHVAKNFSHKERFGCDEPLSHKRIIELTQEKENLKNIFSLQADKSSIVQINTQIKLLFD